MSIASCVASASLVLFAVACAATEQRAADARWNYEVVVRADELVLEARIPPGGALNLSVAPAARRFVREVEDERGAPLFAVDGAWRLPRSSAPRTVRWRFAAREAARSLDDVDLAAVRGNAIVASLSAFLLHDSANWGDGSFRLAVLETAPQKFVCASPDPDDLVGELASLDGPVPCAFGEIIPIPTGMDGVVIAPLMAVRLGELAGIDDWASAAMNEVETYLGRRPVRRLLLLLAPRGTHGIGSGRTLGNGAASIYVSVGTATTDVEFERDWVLTHEMIHLALPSLPPQQEWLEEGSATYLEPLLRARAGRLAENEVWRALLDEYDQGLPEADDAGLDRTRTWGRTYYGGAIFCLLADVEIRARTRNAKSLRDVFVAVLAEEGNLTRASSIERVIEIGDRATGTNVLAELYARMGNAAEPKELGSLWRDLGVALDGDKVVFDDTAPLAFVRRELILGAR
ncbi:MAG: hypothetical protein K8S98_17090 [Planctomycetes bacterium]|nr:hypothetical protein [Planctomycetota bacterium]